MCGPGRRGEVRPALGARAEAGSEILYGQEVPLGILARRCSTFRYCESDQGKCPRLDVVA